MKALRWKASWLFKKVSILCEQGPSLCVLCTVVVVAAGRGKVITSGALLDFFMDYVDRY
jgi:hypothetical protein